MPAASIQFLTSLTPKTSEDLKLTHSNESSTQKKPDKNQGKEPKHAYQFRPIDTAENDIPKVEEYEAYHYLINIDTKKSTISEDYPSWITKHNADILSEPVADIINSMLSESIFPSLWIPVPSLCNDFRPI